MTRIWILVGLISALGGAFPAHACGPELNVDTSLYYDFGVDPNALAAFTDSEALERVAASPNRPATHRLALSRALLWEPILQYRAVADDCRVVIPPDAGEWRLGRVTHPESGRTYDVVHWQDIDDSSYTLYFLKGTDWLCQLAFDN
jgi:hypothetical protein